MRNRIGGCVRTDEPNFRIPSTRLNLPVAHSVQGLKDFLAGLSSVCKQFVPLDLRFRLVVLAVRAGDDIHELKPLTKLLLIG